MAYAKKTTVKSAAKKTVDKTVSKSATQKTLRQMAVKPALKNAINTPAGAVIKKNSKGFLRHEQRISKKSSTQTASSDFWLVSLVLFFAMTAFAAFAAGTTYLSVAVESDFNLAVRTKASKHLSLEIKGNNFSLEVVNMSAEMYRGLSGRKNLCANCGMIFVFPNAAVRSFVMRDMNFPLDIIFLSEGRIVKLYENLAPEGSNPLNFYSSLAPVDTVLEINAGLARQLGLKIGDRLNLPDLSVYR